ncbi:MAG: hypothetical protein QGE95_14310, partial [Arenicellales bacterium]|nr:hypothetical protein [Arenicellales bacterium]
CSYSYKQSATTIENALQSQSQSQSTQIAIETRIFLSKHIESLAQWFRIAPRFQKYGTSTSSSCSSAVFAKPALASRTQSHIQLLMKQHGVNRHCYCSFRLQLSADGL